MKKLMALLAAGLMSFTAVLPVSAAATTADGEIHTAQLVTDSYPDTVIDTTQYGTVTVNYANDLDGSNPIEGAEFTIYKIADIHSYAKDGHVGTDYVSVIPKLQIAPVFQEDVKIQDIDRNSADVWAPVEGYKDQSAVKEEPEVDAQTDEESIVIGADGVSRLDAAGTKAVDTDVDPENYKQLVMDTYKAGLPEGGYSYSMKTDANGKALFKEVPLGVYIMVETAPAPYHVAAATSLFSVPYVDGEVVNGDSFRHWKYDVVVNPKARPCGNLVLSKVLEGDAVEKDKDFHFVITFKEASAYLAARDTEYTYETSDGKTGKISSGDMVSLKGGETMTIQMVPAGTTYSVVEKEANEDGYLTVYENEEGNIVRLTDTHVTVTNSRYQQDIDETANDLDTGERDMKDYLIAAMFALLVLMAVVMFMNKKKNK